MNGSRLARAGFALVAFLVWIVHLELPMPAGTPELDPSWMQAKAWELAHGLAAGREIVFPYGPLGTFFSSLYQREIFGLHLAWELGLELVLAGFLAWAALRSRTWWERAAAVVALVFAPGTNDAHVLLAVLALTLWSLERVERKLPARALVYAALALLGMVKFTYFVLGAACAVAVVVLHTRRRGPAAGARELGLAGAALLLAWIGIGQSPPDLLRWIATSFETASGHNAAMGVPGSAFEVAFLQAVLALATFVLGVHVIGAGRERASGVPHGSPATAATPSPSAHASADATTSAALSPPRALERALAAAVLLATLCIAAKAGFVRHGATSQTFFAVAAAGPFFLRLPETGKLLAAAARGARVAVLAISLFGFHAAIGGPLARPDGLWHYGTQRLRDHLADLAQLPGLRARLDRERAELALKHALPRVRARVGAEGIDAFVYSQAALFLNELAWRPRPVFQSYIAYTRELCELNAAFLESARAPRFALFRFETSDERMPGLEDGPALRVLLRDWRPVLAEKGYVLLERAGDAPRKTTPEVVLERDLAFGEPLDLSELDGACLVLEVEITPTSAAQLAHALLRPPLLHAEVVLAGGRRARWRVVPDLLRAGVMVRPMLEDHQGWIEAFCGSASSSVQSIRFVAEPGGEEDFEGRLRVRVMRDELLLPAPRPEMLRELSYSMFVTMPARVTTEERPSTEILHKRPIMIVHAPAELAFPIGAGAHRLTGRFGIKPEAVLGKCTDGAGFTAIVRTESGAEEVVWSRFLAPTTVAGDRGTQELDFAFTTHEPGELLLRTDVGPQGDGSCDWCFFTEIEVR